MLPSYGPSVASFPQDKKCSAGLSEGITYYCVTLYIYFNEACYPILVLLVISSKFLTDSRLLEFN